MSVQRTPGGLSEITFRCKIVIILNLQNNPSVGYRRQLPLHSGAKVADFSVYLFIAEIWCKQIVYVQTNFVITFYDRQDA